MGRFTQKNSNRVYPSIMCCYISISRQRLESCLLECVYVKLRAKIYQKVLVMLQILDTKFIAKP